MPASFKTNAHPTHKLVRLSPLGNTSWGYQCLLSTIITLFECILLSYVMPSDNSLQEILVDLYKMKTDYCQNCPIFYMVQKREHLKRQGVADAVGHVEGSLQQQLQQHSSSSGLPLEHTSPSGAWTPL